MTAHFRPPDVAALPVHLPQTGAAILATGSFPMGTSGSPPPLTVVVAPSDAGGLVAVAALVFSAVFSVGAVVASAVLIVVGSAPFADVADVAFTVDPVHPEAASVMHVKKMLTVLRIEKDRIRAVCPSRFH
jgi:hypothetical protein